MTMELPKLCLHDTVIAVAACVRAGRVPLVLGIPGVAKTTLARAIAPVLGKALGYDAYPAVECILSNRDAPDIGGWPVTLSDDTVVAKLIGSLKIAAEKPVCLVLDEFLTTPQAVQGPALRLTLERVAGENPLHAGTRIICLANNPDEAPGGIQLTAALVNRLSILRCVPKVDEVADFFEGLDASHLDTELALPDESTWQERRTSLMSSVGSLLRVKPDMVNLGKVPPGSITDGHPFATPRSWDACCGTLAALDPGHVTHASPIAHAVLAGFLGSGVAVAFLGILRARLYLPSVQEIIQDPKNARLPDEKTTHDGHQIGRDINFAAIPLVLEANRIDTAATWVYANRLPPEIVAAVAKKLVVDQKIPPSSPWKKEAATIMFDWGARLSGKRKAA